ncbi:uncharacterized protein K02A2.6-like [Ischnura elegans]|uniref:uncharacterized protein K02A2.6-like n=1 Tax=Ischnura elegans TaxID=197161 RepID=UPI001ED87EFE|nr:uncharacterized protein K02A2.6-like [Ischnura elegans]
MEIDTGSGISIIPENIYKALFTRFILLPTGVKLQTYVGSEIIPIGKFVSSITFNGLIRKGTFTVVKKGVRPLLGRDLICLFKVNVFEICNVNFNEKKDELIKEFKDLFEKSLGCYKLRKIQLTLKEGVKPIFCKPRQVPISFKAKVEKELDRLVSEGCITKVDTYNNEWGTPLVPVLKPNFNVRLCADYKVTINRYLDDVNHVMPRVEEIFQAVQGGKKFSKLDMSNAYNQLELGEETKPLLAWSTHKGIYIPNRLPFGVKPACAIFQKELEKVLQGLDGVKNFLDDVIVTGKSDEEHLHNLRSYY